jgi:hypothetical protein
MVRRFNLRIAELASPGGGYGESNAKTFQPFGAPNDKVTGTTGSLG